MTHKHSFLAFASAITMTCVLTMLAGAAEKTEAWTANVLFADGQQGRMELLLKYAEDGTLSASLNMVLLEDFRLDDEGVSFIWKDVPIQVRCELTHPQASNEFEGTCSAKGEQPDREITLSPPTPEEPDGEEPSSGKHLQSSRAP